MERTVRANEGRVSSSLDLCRVQPNLADRQFHHMESDSIVRGLKYHLCAEDKYGIYKVAIG